MPNRWLATFFVLFWLLMMGLLLERDVVPHWWSGNLPSFKTIAARDQPPQPVRWAILQEDRRIGWAESAWQHDPNGTKLDSHVSLKELPLVSSLGLGGSSGEIRWDSTFRVDTTGNLDSFEILVYLQPDRPSVTVRGARTDDVVNVVFRAGNLMHREQFFYEPHTVLTSSLTPLDKLPNLKVGQTWQWRVMNPLRRTPELVRCSVVREQVLTWKGNPVPTRLVEQRYGGIVAHCWVAHDGTVLRQEVPLGWTTLTLEHQ